MIHEFILPRTPVSLDAGLLNKRAKRKFHFNDLLQKHFSSIEFERFIQEIIIVHSYTYRNGHVVLTTSLKNAK